jgi:opacity protein-like surface antigen
MTRPTFFDVSAAMLLAAGAAAAEDPHWYLQGDAGAGFASQLDGTPHRSGDAGWTIGGLVGRDFANGWRADTEVIHLDARNTRGPSGSTAVWGGFVNGYYNFNHGKAWQPFIGAGVGGADVRSFGVADDGFAYQLKAGLDHPFNDRLTGEIAYRYLGVTGLRDGGPNGVHGDYHTSAVTVGLRYRFGP